MRGAAIPAKATGFDPFGALGLVALRWAFSNGGSDPSGQANGKLERDAAGMTKNLGRPARPY